MLRSINKYPLLSQLNPSSPGSEAYRTLRTKLQYAMSREAARTILVTSAQMNEGKSMTVANLGMAFALADKETLIIDADLRNPTMHHIFQKSNRLGLTHILENGCQPYEVIRDTDIPRLSLITSGESPSNPTELLASKAANTMLAELKDRYDVIIIDSPPFLAMADAQILSGLCDGTVLVVKSGKVKRKAIQKVKAGLEYAGARLLGAILNDMKRNDRNYYDYGKRFG